MRLQTSYFAMAHKVPCPVSISLYPPMWYDGARYSALAPSTGIFRDRKCGVLSDEGFESRYVLEVLGRWADADALILDLERHLLLSGVKEHSEVTLLCFEKPGQLCHRRFLAKWLESQGLSVPECQLGVPAPRKPSDLPKQVAGPMIFESLDF